MLETVPIGTGLLPGVSPTAATALVIAPGAGLFVFLVQLVFQVLELCLIVIRIIFILPKVWKLLVVLGTGGHFEADGTDWTHLFDVLQKVKVHLSVPLIYEHFLRISVDGCIAIVW
jgi:hypothetical protein